MVMVDPTLEWTVIGREAAESMGTRSLLDSGGVFFEPIQIYIRGAINGLA
jgi:hypothetical protein